MQIVIDITDSFYDRLVNMDSDTCCSFNESALVECIKNGTPLPKRHGDLKDSNNLKHAFISWSMAVQGLFTNADIASVIYNSPTILKADKAERSDKV